MTRRAPTVLLLLAAGCSDGGFTVYHEPPTVAIVEPSDGSRVYEGEEFGMKANVDSKDADGDLAGHKALWVSGSKILCEQAEVDPSGFTVCSGSLDEPGTGQTITVTVTNLYGDAVSDTITVDVAVNSPPQISISSPIDGTAFNPEDLIVFYATVNDDEDPEEDLNITFSSNVDGALPVPSTASSAGDYTGATSLSPGSHLITAMVADRFGKTGQDTVVLRINSAPGKPTVDIVPDPAVSDQSLSVDILAEANDPDGDALAYRYDWYRNGSVYSSGSVPSVPQGVVKRGEYWEVRVYATDGNTEGNPGTDAITVANEVPRVDSVNITPSAPDTLTDLKCESQGFYDPEGDSERYRYAWFLNGVQDLGETTETFPAGKTVRDDQVRCEMQPYDSYGDGAWASSATIAVVNSKPTQPIVQITPTSPEPEDSLYCDVVAFSTDADGDAVTYDYIWYKNGTPTTNYTSVLDYTLTSDKETWECRVTPYDGTDSGLYANDAVVISDVTPPGAPKIDPIDAYVNDDIFDLTGTCDPGCLLTFYLSDSTGSWTESDACDGVGNFSATMYLTRGYDTSIYAVCEDSSGNLSASSNTVKTQACTPWDTRELSTGYGDTGPYAIAEWSTLADDASTTVTIQGNALNTSDTDWYRIDTSDNKTSDISAGQDLYNLDVALTRGNTTYAFYVYRGTYDSSGLQCPTSTSGYDEYNFFAQDKGDGGHGVPSNSKACSSGSPYYNDCADFTSTYYVEVRRKSTALPSCEYYELSISNGK